MPFCCALKDIAVNGWPHFYVKDLHDLTCVAHGLRTPNEGINQKIWKFGPMWQAKYALAVPKDLGVGVDFWPWSEGDFFHQASVVRGVACLVSRNGLCYCVLVRTYILHTVLLWNVQITWKKKSTVEPQSCSRLPHYVRHPTQPTSIPPFSLACRWGCRTMKS